jgi:predicted kinase
VTATLFLTCGLPGAGKTTLARRLEREWPALRLTADDWLLDLHPGLSRAELDELRDRVERSQWTVARRALELGINVVLDWGLWGREERDNYRLQARAVGSRVVLYVLDPPLQELWDRVEKRNAYPNNFHITRSEIEAWDVWFERPTADELALFDQAAVVPRTV